MRLTELALSVTLLMLVVTAYLAFDGHRAKLTSEDGRPQNVLQVKDSVEQRLSAIEQQMTNRLEDALDYDPLLGSPPNRPRQSGNQAPSELDLPPPPEDHLGNLVAPDNRGLVTSPPVTHREDETPPLSKLEQQVLKAPAIAQVTFYDTDYNVLGVNAGSDSGLREGVEFSIRRGQYLLGTARITEVDETSAAGEMDLRTVPDGLVVEEGDEVIQKVLLNN